MRPSITCSFDIEDHRPSASAELRFPAHTYRIFDFLDERSIRATIFFVGVVAQDHPELVREAVARGHEVGLHNWRHVHINTQEPEAFRAGVRRGKALLEDLTGAAVLGFRAPTGSIVPKSVWAPEILADEGYVYSSSVMPFRAPIIGGFPGLPNRPFLWPSGLVEFPCPSVGLGPVRIACFGGVFLRVLPWPIIRFALATLPADEIPFTYLHPYDIDTEEEFWVVGEAGRLGSVLLWLNRHRTLDKLDRLLGDRVGLPFGERLAGMDVGALPMVERTSDVWVQAELTCASLVS